uniref:ATP synthase complex subunit 8 n=1 Tax=Lepus corsicanus TaxID=100181 RepID=A0A023NLF4_LEPCR|nr:ATP synthase F0 subunit 8 [Lepus corsicanus]
MPQLDTSTWLVTIIAMILTLFALIQLKFHKYSYPLSPAPKTLKPTSFPNPWETKWTKIYSPLLLPQQ